MTTEQQCREWVEEIRSEFPRKRLGRTIFELRLDGRLDVYTTNRALTRMFFSHTSNPAIDWMDPEVRGWYESRWIDGARFPIKAVAR